MTSVKTKNSASIAAALARKCNFEVIQEDEKATQLRLIGRCPTDRWAFFTPVIYQLLTTSEAPNATWTVDISKKYIKHNDKVVYAWRLIFQGKDLAAQYSNIASTISASSQPARVELTRMLLPGYKEGDVRGGVNARGKGASVADSSPLAVTSKAGRISQ